MLLSMATRLNLRIGQMDAITAFLNGILEEEIYMEQPEPYRKESGKHCKLIKSIYGLKQSSRVWNEALNNVLVNYGLNQSVWDQCIYYSKRGDDILIVAIYVDDILIFTNKEDREMEMKAELSRNFKMKDLGEATSILGIRITRNNKKGLITIDQSRYITEIIQKFNMQDCNSVATPLDINQKISLKMCPKTGDEKDEMKRAPYREAIGSLLFAAMITRPDICGKFAE